ncbi:hypothetical protein CDAR_164511 [Caerostris darwini]|uniref:Uncharacterized protein n=1 Tax=Caerostris darwini TaxID=1538125 RepID=A0AAV4QU27_9ARAC|nr:hypothetical protein CDAR_164511 [Caerostris darwini]
MRKQRRTLRKRSSKKKSREGLCGQGSYFWGRTYAKGAIYRGQNGDNPSGHPDGEDLEEQRRGVNVPNPCDLRDIFKGKFSLEPMKDIGVPNITRTGRQVKFPETFNL